MKIIIIYCIFMNLLGIILFAYDKRHAIQHKWRIPERKLFLAALLGGAPGAILGMYLFHHKTQKMKFVIGMPLILLLHVVLIYYGYHYFPGMWS